MSCKKGGFVSIVWERRQQTFLDLRIFDSDACRSLDKLLQQCHVINEQEKKRAYNERVLQIEHGTITPLVFPTYGSIGRECCTFYSRLSDLLSEKPDLPKSITMKWVHAKMSFALLKSSLLCLRGSQTVSRNVAEFESDVVVSEFFSRI